MKYNPQYWTEFWTEQTPLLYHNIGAGSWTHRLRPVLRSQRYQRLLRGPQNRHLLGPTFDLRGPQIRYLLGPTFDLRGPQIEHLLGPTFELLTASTPTKYSDADKYSDSDLSSVCFVNCHSYQLSVLIDHPLPAVQHWPCSTALDLKLRTKTSFVKKIT